MRRLEMWLVVIGGRFMRRCDTRAASTPLLHFCGPRAQVDVRSHRSQTADCEYDPF